MSFRGVIRKVAGTVASLVVWAQPAQAGLSSDIVKVVKNQPLNLRPFADQLREMPIFCTTIIMSAGHFQETSTFKGANPIPNSLLEAGIALDRLAGELFALFPEHVHSTSLKVYFDEFAVTYSPEHSSSRAGFASSNEQRARWRPTVILPISIARTYLVRKLSLFYETLRLALIRTSLQWNGVFDHWPEDDSDQVMVDQSRYIAHFVERLILEQIPLEYLQKDLESGRVPADVRNFFLGHFHGTRSVPLQGFFSHPAYAAGYVPPSPEVEAQLSTWVDQVLE